MISVISNGGCPQDPLLCYDEEQGITLTEIFAFRRFTPSQTALLDWKARAHVY